MPPLAFIADRRDNGQTLAAVLKTHYALSWTKAKQTIERRHVRVAGQIIADAAFRVKVGKRVTVAVGAIENGVDVVKAAAKAPPKPKLDKPGQGPAVLIEIIYADDDVVVVNKPAGITTSRSAEDKAEFGKGERFLPGTLADKIPAALGERKAKIIPVHRLDQGTSGLIVFARNKLAAQHLAKQFKAHSVERKYLALVRGCAVSGKLESAFVDDRGDGRRGSGDGGVRAVTHVTVVQQGKETALVECRLETGRTHQVRIHLGEAGTPLCGERVYDRPRNGKPKPDTSGAARPMLHAAVLGFEHPSTGATMRFEKEPPADFASIQKQGTT